MEGINHLRNADLLLKKIFTFLRHNISTKNISFAFEIEEAQMFKIRKKKRRLLFIYLFIYLVIYLFIYLYTENHHLQVC